MTSARAGALAGIVVLGSLAGFLAAPPAQALTVSNAGSLPTARDAMSAVSDGAHVFAFGGYGGGLLSDVLRIDPASGSVDRVASLPTGRAWTSAVWDGSGAYVFGGYDGAFLRQILRFDPATGSVHAMPQQLPSERDGTSAVWDGAHAFIFGGGTSSVLLTEIVRYDPAAGTVQVMNATLPEGRKWAATVWDGEAAWLFGGSGASGPLDEVLRYDPSADTLTLAGHLPEPRTLASVTWDGARATLLGGTGPDGAGRASILRFDPSTGTFGSGWNLPSNRSNMAAAWAGGVGLTFGGRQAAFAGAYLQDIVRFDLRPLAPLDVRAVPGNLGQIDVSWRAPPGATSDLVQAYRVYRGAQPGNLTLLAEVNASTLQFVDTPADLLATEYYQLASVNPYGESPLSALACSRPFPAAELPSTDPLCPAPPGWTETTLESYHLALPARVGAGATVVDGHPDSANPQYYVLTVQALGQPPQSASVFAAGALQSPVHEALPALAPTTDGATVRVLERYDPADALCLVVVNGGCPVAAPFDPADPDAVPRDGPAAAIIVDVVLTDQGQPAQELPVSIPFAGQALGAR